MSASSLTPSSWLPGTPFALRFNADKTEAYVCAGSPTKRALDSPVVRDELLLLLKARGFQNMDLKGLRQALPEILEKEEMFCFARGVPPAPGQDGQVRCFFDPNPLEKAWQAEDSAPVDFRQGAEINNVRAGDLLAELIPPIPPRPGADVFGNPIPARAGRPARLIAGRNTRLEENGQRVYAQMDGCVKKVRHTILVDRVKIINGDVDFGTGNIRFNGDVVILGDVKETFSVEAEGSIRVAGIVDRARLKAGADIQVEGGLYGREDVNIEAGGNISVSFAENADLVAHGSIYAGLALVNCRAWADEKIYLKSVGKALIGGRVVGVLGVEARSLGNPRIPTPTVVEFGVRPELTQRIRQLGIEFNQADDARRAGIEEELETLRNEYDAQKNARVIVKDITYPGVILKTDKASYEARTEISSMIYYRVEGRNEISMRAYGEKKRNRP